MMELPRGRCVTIAPIMESAAERMQMRNDPPRAGRLFSIGHSNHDPATFLRLLRLNGVTALADVPPPPTARAYPQFNREELRRMLEDAAILYLFLGDQLGGRPTPRRPVRRRGPRRLRAAAAARTSSAAGSTGW